MDELHERLVQGRFDRRFAAFTLDDGYRDNRDHALPVLREFDAPATVYVASDFAEGTGRLWWAALEAVIAKTEQIEIQIGNSALRLDATTPAAKQAAFDRLHDWLRALPGEHDLKREIEALCASTVSTWLRCAAALPVLGRGETVCRRSAGHDRRPYHQPLQSCQAERGDRRAGDGGEPRADRARAGAPVAAFRLSLWRPRGGRDARIRAGASAGFKTAVTTRPGMLFAENAGHMTALPRVSLNGNYQDTRILPVLTSGAATAMWNGFRRLRRRSTPLSLGQRRPASETADCDALGV